MKTRVAYSDRSGAGKKAAMEIASRLGADIGALEPESRLVRMSWMRLFDMAEPIPGWGGISLLVLCVEVAGQSLAPEEEEMLVRHSTRGGSYALVIVSSLSSGRTGSVIKKFERAVGSMALATLEAQIEQVAGEPPSDIWSVKLDRFIEAMGKAAV